MTQEQDVYDEDELFEDVMSDDGDEQLPNVQFTLPRGMTVYITTDNASNITKAVNDSEFELMRCFAHTINLAVQNGLKVPGIVKHIARVRKVVKHFRKSYKAKYSLEVRFVIPIFL